MDQIKFYPQEEVIVRISEYIENSLQSALTKKDRVLWALPGGRSVEALFPYFIQYDIDWHRVHIFWVDERFLSLNHKESNYYKAETLFLSQLLKENRISFNNIHPIPYDKKYTLAQSAAIYTRTFHQYGQDYFDCLLLGSGEDGHIASLFPQAIDTWSNQKEFIPIQHSPKWPNERISLSPKLIQNSHDLVLLILGNAKTSVLESLIAQKSSIKDCPSYLVLESPKYTIFTDINILQKENLI